MARSWFWIWPAHIRRRRRQNFEILSPPEPNMVAIFKIMISPDHVFCFIPRMLEIIPRVIGFWKMYLVFSKTWKIYLAFSKIWKHIFQSRRQKLRREGYIGRKDTCFFVKTKVKAWCQMRPPPPLMENAVDFFHFFYPFPIMGWMFWCKKSCLDLSCTAAVSTVYTECLRLLLFVLYKILS